MTRKIILHGGGMDGHPEGIPAIVNHFKGCQRVALIPYARANHDKALAFTRDLVPEVRFFGVHTMKDPRDAVANADGIWVMGGNSFSLVNQLHAYGLIEPVQRMVEQGIPYGGTSAGANVAGPTICTTNDMPIIRRLLSLDGFELVPFQINPHYLDANAKPADFCGHTREQRIAEFLEENDVPVLGLREGSWLTVNSAAMRLDGTLPAMLFERNKQPRELPAGSDLSTLLTVTPRFIGGD
ncbi:MAG: dipeptidase PepE [Candidatus Dormibacteraceae bacterium]